MAVSTPTHCPALLVSAPASGQGKTTVVAALARLHARRGHRVRVFKCGPDFLDPFWLQLACGSAVDPLDLWINGEADCQQRLSQAASEADLILVEGAMGLFDGDPSPADLAQRFGLAVLAVVDASAMAGTFGALAWGLQHYRPGLRWAGVVANRVASERHADMLQASVQPPEGQPSPWLGAMYRHADVSLPERHLGLTVATEVPNALARLDAAADTLAQTPLGRLSLQDLPRWNGRGASVACDTTPQTLTSSLAGVTVAVARDAAFCFVYEANLACLRRLGARVVLFSPLADAHLPACDAVWLPGGYPELHAHTLSCQHTLRSDLAHHVAQGKPVWAECGGMMLLFDQLFTLDGQAHAMWGLLPGTVRMQQRLAGLGPQQLTLGSEVMRGHTFHYSVCDTPVPEVGRSARPLTPVSPGQGEALYQWGSIRASYFHAWFDASPAAVVRLFTPDVSTLQVVP